MTEEEAKTKWCPSRQLVVQTGWKNSDTKSAKCIGSDCMMWRWEVSPKDANEINGRGNANAKASGYCGLTK